MKICYFLFILFFLLFVYADHEQLYAEDGLHLPMLVCLMIYVRVEKEE